MAIDQRLGRREAAEMWSALLSLSHNDAVQAPPHSCVPTQETCQRVRELQTPATKSTQHILGCNVLERKVDQGSTG